MTEEQRKEILDAINALNDGRTYLHAAMMACRCIDGEDGNALLQISDMANSQLLRARSILYRVNGAEPPENRSCA